MTEPERVMPPGARLVGPPRSKQDPYIGDMLLITQQPGGFRLVSWEDVLRKLYMPPMTLFTFSYANKLCGYFCAHDECGRLYMAPLKNASRFGCVCLGKPILVQPDMVADADYQWNCLWGMNFNSEVDEAWDIYQYQVGSRLSVDEWEASGRPPDLIDSPLAPSIDDIVCRWEDHGLFWK